MGLYALVYWPDTGNVAAIPRAALWRATVDGADLIADELDILSEPIQAVDTAGQSNPRRIADEDGA